MKKLKKVAALLLACVLVVGTTACSSKGTETKETNKETTTQEASGETQASADSTSTEEKKDIYLIVKVIGNQYWAVVQAGAEKAAEELGCNVTIVGVAAESDIEGQISLLQSAVSAQADGIVIGPVDSTSLANPVKEAYNSGIPVVLVDTTVNGDDYSACLMTDNVEAGRMAAAEMIEKLKASGVSETEEAQIAVQVGSTGSQTIIDRLAGFNEYWAANAPASWVVLDDIKCNDGSIEKATTFCQDFLTAYPNLKGVFGPNNGSTVGFVTGLMEAERKDIVMIGFDYSDEIANMIASGEYIVSSVVQKQYYMGYNGVKLALELANGGTVTEKLVDTGVLMVDAENVNSDEVQSVINP